MSNDEVRQFEFACCYTIMMNGSLAGLVKWLGMPPEWWVLMLCVALISAMVLLSLLMVRGWMPKDKPDWDGFGAYCQRKYKGDDK